MESENDDGFMDSAADTVSTSNNKNETQSISLQNLNSLPFKRQTMDQWNSEFHEAVEYQPKLMELFDEPPPISLKNSSDAESIKQMREYYLTKTSRKRQLTETVDKNTEMCGNHIKKQLCHIDLAYLQSQTLKSEIEQLKEEFADLSCKTQMLQKENSALKTRLTKYQASDQIDRQRTEDARNRAKLKEVAIAKQRNIIQQVEAVLEATPGAVATLRKRFDQKENNASKTQTRKPIYRARFAPSVATESTSSSGSNVTVASRFHRRSQSVGAALHRR